MKITDIQGYPVWNGKRNFLFVTVDTDEGISGVGEAGHHRARAGGDGGDRAFPATADRAGPDADRAPLAAALSRRLLPRPAHPRQRDLGDRHRALGHQGQGARRAGLRAARRAGARQGRLLPPQRRARRWRSRRWSSPACKRRRRAGSSSAGGCRTTATCWSRARRSRRPWSSSRRCARRSATRSRSASTSTRASTSPTRCASAARSSRSGPSSSRTRCARRTPIRFKTLRPRTAVPLAAGEQFSSTSGSSAS